MIVLIADSFPESGRAELARIGCHVVYEPDAKDAALIAALTASQAEVLVVRSTRVTAEALSCGCLTLVVRAGAGYNTIDVAAASARGIYIANCPGKNSIAVAELAFGLIIALDRRIIENVVDLRGGRWNKKEYSKARGLYERTLGLIGLGRIGLEMLGRAQAFGMKIAAWSRSLSQERAASLGVERKPSPLEVAQAADIVSIHLALKDQTRRLIGREFFQAMRPGSLFINTSRAEIVDQAELESAVRARCIRAGLDVFDQEPSSSAGQIDAPIFKLDDVIGTHHIGASTEQAQQAIADEAVRIIREFKKAGHAPNAVNLAAKSPATHALVVRHFDRIGVLASVFTKLKSAGINVQETENLVFEGAAAAVARINLDQAPAPELIDSIKSSSADIIDVTLLVL